MTSDMLTAFDKFKGTVDDAYAAARDRLAAGDYEGCHTLLARISMTHVRTSTSFKNLAIKRGYMKEIE